ncbi:preprotein translocase subunit YajC [Arcanobacterium pluranimalium]|uniref:preprotein translocase subunit YajC n=1 Tax=Arcanobacterium pluranimalium TaxID=108028 RepID=UPI00195B2CD5|nr:preprotein translocase subunit YajC [Arcanobacterium pluranimalium]MBM7825467.1 preprotein translocase subunit YajC [Arcanobacterium pluranimalium]
MPGIEILVLLVVMVGFIWFMNAGAKKAQRAQLEQREKAIAVGNNVVTTSGFFGRIVDIDGDAVTLESPSGDETVWLKTSIMAEMNIPVAEISEEEAALIDGSTQDLSGDESPVAQEPEDEPFANPADNKPTENR